MFVLYRFQTWYLKWAVLYRVAASFRHSRTSWKTTSIREPEAIHYWVALIRRPTQPTWSLTTRATKTLIIRWTCLRIGPTSHRRRTSRWVPSHSIGWSSRRDLHRNKRRRVDLTRDSSLGNYLTVDRCLVITILSYKPFALIFSTYNLTWLTENELW